MQQNPPTYEASAGDTHLQVLNSLPVEVDQCLRNARFLHLATITPTHGSPSSSNTSSTTPHLSLMYYTYFPPSTTPYNPHTPIIVMTTNALSKKTDNLLQNPNVCLLVHDWVTHRPITTLTSMLESANALDLDDNAQATAGNGFSLSSFLASLNVSEMRDISAEIVGEARLVERGTEEEKWLRERHCERNHLTSEREGGNVDGEGQQNGNGEHVAVKEEPRVVVVRVKSGRTSDLTGAVRDWSLREIAEGEVRERLINE